MGLTNDRADAQKKLETYQALIDIAAGVKELAAGPDFADLAKVAYALPENEQKKADEGRAIIAELDAKNADLVLLQKDLKEEQDNIDVRVSQLSDASAKLAADNNKLKEREDIATKREKQADDREKKQNDRDIVLSEREAKLRAGEVNLENDTAKLASEKEESRRKADEIKKLTEGL